jgi:hypothetical protein
MDSGLLTKYYHRGGGYYIDLGGSQLVIDGEVKVKHDYSCYFWWQGR